MPAIEIVILPFKGVAQPENASDTVGKAMEAHLAYILNSAGALCCYWGQAIEWPNLIYLFVEWNIAQDHNNFLSNV